MKKKYFNGNSYGLNLQPTVCEIKTSSRELKEISAVGGGEFIAKSLLKPTNWISVLPEAAQ